MTGASDANREQAREWNERAGPRWVAMERDLDAQLEPFGLAAASRLPLVPGMRVLDVGCGAGATSLMLAERVAPGEVVGLDISAPLIARARERAASIANVRFELGDAQTMPLAAGSFDAMFSRFGVMFFSDPVAAFTSLRGALRPGGALGFVCWRAMRENPSFLLPLDAVRPMLPEAPAPPDPLAPGPFAFADAARVESILARAGWSEIGVHAHDASLVFGGRSDLDGAVELALQVGPLSRALASHDDALRARARDAVREAFAPHHGPAGVTLPAATWIVTARA